MSSDAPPPEFNVITEAWFEDMEDYYAMAATTSDPAIAKIIADDVENFLDRGAMTMFLVNERITKQGPTADVDRMCIRTPHRRIDGAGGVGHVRRNDPVLKAERSDRKQGRASCSNTG